MQKCSEYEMRGSGQKKVDFFALHEKRSEWRTTIKASSSAEQSTQMSQIAHSGIVYCEHYFGGSSVCLVVK